MLTYTGYFLGIFLRGGILACEPVVGGSLGCIILHYYYCQSEGGGTAVKALKIPCGHRFIKILKKQKAIVQGFFFRGPRKCVEKSNPSESKRKEKLNGTCFSCIVRSSREL